MYISDFSSNLYRRKRAFMKNFDDPNVEAQYAPDLELEPIHLDIDLYIDVANQTASGRVTTTVKARRNGPTVLTLNALDFEQVSVRDSDGHELSWRYDESKITIDWQTPFTTGEERRVEVSYRVVQPVDGMFFSQPNEAYPNQPWYATTDHETERARHWLPSIDLPNVRTTLDFHLRAEARFTILANGYLVQETDHNDGTKTAHWKLEQLCPSYLICFAIGDFIHADDGIFNDGEKEIQIAYFCSREHSADDLRRTFGRTKKMMAWMTKRLAMPFPYPKYYQYALPGISGAMENISLVSWGDNWIQDESSVQEVEWWVDQLNVHEMAHSYFGDAIVCRDFAHAWLKESWATYIEQCWREDNYTQDEALYVYYSKATFYFKEADHFYKRPIITRRFKSSWQMFDAHLYEGGACRLHTLRCELGDEVFWPAVCDYLQRYNGQVVETDHFRHIMEEHSGRSLGRFFDQWFYTPGYPSLKISFSYDDKQKLGSFEIEQTQIDKKAGIPAFVFSTDISWIIDGQEHRLPITLNQAKQIITITMSAEPEQVRFDPDCKVLHKLSFNPGSKMLRKQLTEAKDIIGRIQAANELAKTHKRANINAIVDAYANEPFWGVRREFAKALGEANSDAGIAGLAKLIMSEQDPMVMRNLLRTASNYRDRRIRDAIATRLKNGLPHFATMNAYEALGAQRHEAPWELLLEGIKEEGYNGLAQSGAFRGLGATRRSEAIDLLLHNVAYGNSSNRSRSAAVSALADIGQGQEKAIREQIIETLIDLLRDPWYRVRKTAAYGLQTMKATQAIGALDAFAHTLSYQDQVEVEQIIASLRQQDKTDGSAFKKQIQELQEKVRKLEDTVQKLEAKMESAKAE